MNSPKPSVELLYFDGCPTYKKAQQDIDDVLRESGINAEVAMLKVESEEDAERLRFLGSPTVRVNGVDVDPSARESKDYGLRCRVYRVGGKIGGSPSREMLGKALREAN